MNTESSLIQNSETINAEFIKEQVQSITQEKIFWFPVRHHSPSAAFFLEKALRKRKPRIVFIEGPAEANHLVPFIIDKKTKPPVAIYSSFRDDDNVLGMAGKWSAAENIPVRLSVWYPLMSYSPEYIAMQVAEELKAEVVFIDLPNHAEVFALKQLKEDQGNTPTPSEAIDSETEPNDENAKDKIPASRTRGSSNLIVTSDFYKSLTEVAGYRSWDETWDCLFEVRDFADFESFRVELAHFCAAARATTNRQLMHADGTIVRERHMWQTINKTLAEKNIKPEDAFIVCGGFHLFLDRNDTTPAPESPGGTLYSTLVPYSFFRVSELSGYGAGNRAPQYYQTLYEYIKSGKTDSVLVNHVVAVLDKARAKKGLPLSAADTISVCQHAEMLARLRGRSLPVLDDIHDAIITCCCKGNPAEDGIPLFEAMDLADIGNKIGRVSPGLGQLPIVSDFYSCLDVLELDEVLEVEKRKKVELDKRAELDNRRSAFLHRLLFLKVPLVSLLEAPTDLTSGRLFREKWLLVWEPQVESSLIELNSYGDTVESATLSMLREALALDHLNAGRVCKRLVEAIDMDLPELIHEVEDACAVAIDNDSRFSSLSMALNSLLIIDRYAIYRNLRRNLLNDLIIRCYDRACFAILDIIAAPEDQQQQVVSSLLLLADLVQRATTDRPDLDRQLFVQHVSNAAALTTVPFLRGAFLGILAELREISTETLAQEFVNLSRSTIEQMLTGGDLLDGVMSVSKTSIMLGADSLIVALDELLRAVDLDSFLTMLPKMRSAFERLHERNKDSFAAQVAQKYGLEEKESLRELRTSLGAAAIITRIDAQVATIMKEWEF